MPTKIISGTLTIPITEPVSGGFYTDLELRLFFVTGSTEALDQTHTVPTNNTFSFTYQDLGQQVKVKLFRVSTNSLLSETATRGVLPRSFLVPNTDSLYFTDFIHANYTFDAGLAIIASAGGRYFDLAKEITTGITLAEVSNSVPFKVNHVVPTGADAYYRTGTVAMVAYSLGYYLEQKPNADNRTAVATTLYHLLTWLANKRSSVHGNLLTAGNGGYTGSTFDPSFVDDYASIIDNILAFFAFKQAGKILNSTYQQVAGDVKASIMNKLYDPQLDIYYAGIYPTGVNLNGNLESKLVTAFFLVEEGDVQGAKDLMLDVEQSYVVVDSINNITGYKATSTDSKVWFEGSYMVALGYYKSGNKAKFKKIVKELNKLLEDDGSFRYGILKNGQYQVLDYKSVGSTAWSFILNMFPEDMFTIGSAQNILPGLPTIYPSQESAQMFTKNDCVTGSGTSVIYRVLAGTYISTISQSDANALANADVTSNGQAYANANGTCIGTITFTSAQTQAYFFKNNCGPGLQGSAVLFTVPAGMFTSTVSQADADLQASHYLFQNGQAYANTNGSCSQGLHLVHLTANLTLSQTAFSDDAYGTFFASEALQTFVDIDWEYTVDAGMNWISGQTVTMFTGAVTTASFFITSTLPGAGTNIQFRITNVTPTTFGNQLYTFQGNVVQNWLNVQRSGTFVKNNCPGGVPGSTVTYTVAAGTYSSLVSQADADAQADADVAANGQNYANSHGTCQGQTAYYNVLKSQLFQKQGCSTGFDGQWVIYTVPAGTYSSTISQADADLLADLDIATNGQSYANLNGACLPSANTIYISLVPHIDGWGPYDHLYVKATASQNVSTDINVYYNYEYQGSQYLGGMLTIPHGSFESPQVYIGQYPPGDAGLVNFTISLLNPTDDGGYHYTY